MDNYFEMTPTLCVRDDKETCVLSFLLWSFGLFLRKTVPETQETSVHDQDAEQLATLLVINEENLQVGLSDLVN